MGALGKVKDGGSLEDFFVHLGQRQERINRIRAGWDVLPHSVFPSNLPRQDFLKRLSDSGVFRMLAEAGDDPLKFYSAKLVCYVELEGLARHSPCHRDLVRASPTGISTKARRPRVGGSPAC